MNRPVNLGKNQTELRVGGWTINRWVECGTSASATSITVFPLLLLSPPDCCFFSHLYEWNVMVCLRLPRFSSSYCSSCPCGRPRCSGAITTRSYRQRRTGSWGRTTCGPQRLRGQRLAAHLTLVPWNFTRRRCQMSSETGLCPPGDSCKQQPEHILNPDVIQYLTRSIWSKWCFKIYKSPF